MTKDSCYGPRRRVGYTVRFTATARRDLHKLPPRVLSAVIEFAFGDLAREPRRRGKPLRRELTGLYSARRGPYRLLYRIASSEPQVRILPGAPSDQRKRWFTHRPTYPLPISSPAHGGGFVS